MANCRRCWVLRLLVIAKDGRGVILNGWCFYIILLTLIFAPFYFKTQIATLPQFLEKRYGPASRTFVAFMGTVIGGLKSVMLTETVQTIILISGAVLLTIFPILELPRHGIISFALFKDA